MVAHLQGLRVVQAQWAVGGGDDEPARREVLAHHVAEDHLAGGVERGGRFIEKPDRATHCEQARERQTAALTGGEISGGKLGEAIEPHSAESLIGSTSAAQELGPERQVLRHGQRRFERVEVRQVMRLLAKHRIRPGAIETDFAFARPQQTGDDAQQGGLARPVRAGQHQGLPGFDREIHLPEDRQPTASAGEAGAGNQHHASVGQRATRNANLRQCLIIGQRAVSETEYACCG